MTGTHGSLQLVPADVTELNSPIQGHSVPLPEPGPSLAALIAAVIPPTAPTLATPFVRMPVIARPAISDTEAEEHLELAVERWGQQWTLRERSRVSRALDADTETVGARYERACSTAPWLMVTLERCGVAWPAALALAERLLSPAPDSTVDDENWNMPIAPPLVLPDLGDPRGTAERVLMPYRRLALTVLADIGAPSIVLELLGDPPQNENRQPSRLVQAAHVCGITRPGVENPTRGATHARHYGRSLLARVGVWPWCRFEDGTLPPRWHADSSVTASIAAWLKNEEARNSWAMHSRRRLAQQVGLWKT